MNTMKKELQKRKKTLRTIILKISRNFYKFNIWYSVTHRNVYDNGFLLDEGLKEYQADAAFIDLPSPWLSVSHINRAIKIGGKVCNFSPCIEQVQKMVCE